MYRFWKVDFLLICVLFLASVLSLNAEGVDERWHRHPYLGKREKQAIKDYLLPSDHPAFAALEAIFSSTRATENIQSLQAAGFHIVSKRSCTHIIVASHPATPKYLFKIYLDDELRKKGKTSGWKWFVRRIEAARKIRQYIAKNHVKHFTVPRKWIYLLPLEPSPPVGGEYKRKNEILVVEKMNLVSMEENLTAWKTRMTKEHLKELYAIIRYVGGTSYRPDNVAYTKEGKFAFVDTEYAHLDPGYKDPLDYLSQEMADYWWQLINRD